MFDIALPVVFGFLAVILMILYWNWNEDSAAGFFLLIICFVAYSGFLFMDGQNSVRGIIVRGSNSLPKCTVIHTVYAVQVDAKDDTKDIKSQQSNIEKQAEWKRAPMQGRVLAVLQIDGESKNGKSVERAYWLNKKPPNDFVVVNAGKYVAYPEPGVWVLEGCKK